MKRPAGVVRQGIIQASWNWPFSRKDFEVYGERGYAIATGGNSLRVRLAGDKEEARTPSALPVDDRDSLSYLITVVRHKRKVSGLSSLENNMIVTAILTRPVNLPAPARASHLPAAEL